MAIIKGGPGKDKLIGTADDDKIYGFGGDDVLVGAGGDDTLEGDIGNDTLKGGDGNDILRGHEGHDLLYGQSGNDQMYGGDGNDFLDGGIGNDTLAGGEGDDTLRGGDGIDTVRYVSSWSGVQVDLAITTPQDTWTAGYDALTDIENVIGSSFDDIIRGNALANMLDGGDGNDSLWAGDGDDTLEGGLGSDTLRAGSGVDWLSGGEGADTMSGGAGNDILIGGAGADALDGGAGWDYAAYFNAASGVTASLANAAANGGGDTYVGIEALAGSNFNDSLRGNGDPNWLIGQGGADRLDGGGGFDYAGYQNATAAVTADLSNRASNNGEAVGDTYVSIEGLVGTNFNDVLVGNAQDNWLVGRAGADNLNGRVGFDYAAYFTSSIGITVSLATPASNTGDAAGDTYRNIEGLAGSSFNDTLIGNSANNCLLGEAGADTLTGGLGNDHFSFTSALVVGNVDQITDFNVENDIVQLENGVFTGLTVTGTLAAGAFHIGAAAADADHRIIYNSVTGGLFYDRNGSAVGGNVQFAQLTTGLALTSADFFVA